MTIDVTTLNVVAASAVEAARMLAGALIIAAAIRGLAVCLGAWIGRAK